VEATSARPTSRRWLVVGLGAAVLVVGAVVVNLRLDPYRVGTTHETVFEPGTDVEACGAHWTAQLDDGSTWIPTGAVSGSAGEPVVTIPGTITITGTERGRFESDPEVGSRLFEVVVGAAAADCTPSG
jgi:hypothetical protein